MSTSRTHEVHHGDRIPLRTLEFFRNRLRTQLFDLVVSEYTKQARAGFTKRDLARRISRRPEQITRWLGTPSNWTLETVSDLLLAISEAELSVCLRKLNRLDKTTDA
jgi:hypothetical protein